MQSFFFYLPVVRFKKKTVFIIEMNYMYFILIYWKISQEK